MGTRRADYRKYGLNWAGAALLTFVLYYIVAAASLSGFYGKWGFLDGRPGFGFVQILEGTGDRPYVFRELVPATVNAIDRMMPQSVRARLLEHTVPAAQNFPGETKQGMLRGIADDPKYAIRYYLIYIICFISQIIGMFFIYRMCIILKFSHAASFFTPIIFAIILPIIESRGGFFYDFPEIAFTFAFLDVFLNRRFFLLALPIAVLGTANKESFLFFMACAAPLVIRDRRDLKGVASLVLCLLAGAGEHYLEMLQFKLNPGFNTIPQLMQNLKYIANPANLLSVEVTYRIDMFTAYSAVALAVLVAMVRFSRGSFGPRLKIYALLTVGVNLCLVLLYSDAGEMRNFSFSYPVLILLIAATTDRLLSGSTEPAGQEFLGPRAPLAGSGQSAL